MPRLLLALAVLTLTSCKAPGETYPDAAEPPGQAEVPGEPAQDEEWTAGLQPEPGFAGIAGTVHARITDGVTHLSIHLRGAEPGRRHGWQLRHGPCEGDAGETFRHEAAYPPLPTDRAGRSEAEVTLPAELDPGQMYHVTIHPEPGDDRVMACGTLATEHHLDLE